MTTARLREYAQFDKYTWQVITVNNSSLYRVSDGQYYVDGEIIYTPWTELPAALLELLYTHVVKQVFDGDTDILDGEEFLFNIGRIDPQLLEKLQASGGAIFDS